MKYIVNNPIPNEYFLHKNKIFLNLQEFTGTDEFFNGTDLYHVQNGQIIHISSPEIISFGGRRNILTFDISSFLPFVLSPMSNYTILSNSSIVRKKNTSGGNLIFYRKGSNREIYLYNFFLDEKDYIPTTITTFYRLYSISSDRFGFTIPLGEYNEASKTIQILTRKKYNIAIGPRGTLWPQVIGTFTSVSGEIFIENIVTRYNRVKVILTDNSTTRIYQNFNQVSIRKKYKTSSILFTVEFPYISQSCINLYPIENRRFSDYTFLSSHNGTSWSDIVCYQNSTNCFGDSLKVSDQCIPFEIQFSFGIRSYKLPLWLIGGEYMVQHGNSSIFPDQKSISWKNFCSLLSQMFFYYPKSFVVLFIDRQNGGSPANFYSSLKETGLENILLSSYTEYQKIGFWPTFGELMRKNQKLLIITDIPRVEGSESPTHPWGFIFSTITFYSSVDEIKNEDVSEYCHTEGCIWESQSKNNRNLSNNNLINLYYVVNEARPELNLSGCVVQARELNSYQNVIERYNRLSKQIGRPVNFLSINFIPIPGLEPISAIVHINGFSNYE